MNTYGSVGQRTAAVASPKPKHNLTPAKPVLRSNVAGQEEPVKMKMATGIVNRGLSKKAK